MKMKNLVLLLAVFLLLSGCIAPDAAKKETFGGPAGYETISAKQAKEMMDSGENNIILDVRTQAEYDARHIPGAVLLPYDEIESRAESVLKDKDQLILVYCRTGRRSQLAAETLASLGYTNVKDFGGIAGWPYETVS